MFNNALIIGNTIKDLRMRRNIGQQELANIVGISKNYISAIERGVKVPAIKLLHQIIDVLGNSDEEKVLLKKKLGRLLSEMKYYYLDDLETNKDNEVKKPPQYIHITKPFIERLKRDLYNKNTPYIYREIINIEKIEKGETPLTKEDVVKIAKMLNQPIDAYLLLTLQVPDDYKNLLQHESVINLMRSISGLKDDELDEAVNSIQNVINFYIKYGSSIKQKCSTQETR